MIITATISQDGKFGLLQADLVITADFNMLKGEVAEISGPDGITEFDFSRAFKRGECSDEVFEAIARFYQEKEERIKSFL